jgi:hypothetical protein
MKKVSTIGQHVAETLLTPEETPTKQIKKVDIHKNPKHVLTPPVKLFRNKSDIAGEYSKLLYERVQRYPQVFTKGLMKLLEYHNQGIQVQLDDGGAGYAELAKDFFIAFAEYISDNVTRGVQK